MSSPLWMSNLTEAISDSRVIEAMRAIPRFKFIPQEYSHDIEEDKAIPIGYNQTISQPSLVGKMLELASVRQRDTVMEVGSGSGYVCALLSRLCKEVIGFERILDLTVRSRKILTELSIKNVQIFHSSDGHLDKGQKYDVIIVSAAAKQLPSPLISRLKVGGTLICPVGSMAEQNLMKVTKHPKGESISSLEGCRFVPLIGKYCWDIDEIRPND